MYLQRTQNSRCGMMRARSEGYLTTFSCPLQLLPHTLLSALLSQRPRVTHGSYISGRRARVYRTTRMRQRDGKSTQPKRILRPNSGHWSAPRTWTTTAGQNTWNNLSSRRRWRREWCEKWYSHLPKTQTSGANNWRPGSTRAAGTLKGL
jgi:hypothetical protein